jgi:hypothetical protein
MKILLHFPSLAALSASLLLTGCASSKAAAISNSANGH